MPEANERRIFLIANPRAGRGRRGGLRRVERFRELLARRGVGAEVAYTSGPADATRLAREAAAAGFRGVVVSGGDGTINEALQGLVGTGARLGIWPSGTANVLARQLALPFDAEGAAACVARGAARKVYAGCAVSEATGERRYFLLMAGIGLDASIVERVRPALKRRVGEAAFWVSGLSHLARWQPAPFELEVGGETIPATFAAVGKAARYGGDLGITPRARMDEPDFEVCAVDSHSRIRYLRLLSHALRREGVGEQTASVRFLRATRLRAAGDAPVQVDGELIGHLPMTFEIVPDPVEIIAPRPKQNGRKIGYQNLR
jgi:diacylglycerol kinase (ATP)